MIPQLQIVRQPALQEMNSKKAELSIRQQRPDMQIETSQAKMNISQPRPDMEIDQHQAWRAYNGGTALEMNRQIYSELPALFLEGLAKRVEQGNRMAEIHLPGNTISEIYGSDWKRDPFVEYRAPASYDNVDIYVNRNRPEIAIEPIAPQISAQAYTPEIEYNPGFLEIRMKQYGSIEIIPPQIDMTM
ncbi:DUF6470 family protein [Paenibacillus sp. N3/727]|uniref:DUF6470 family protein n=1 Tax=Paenibacillus sp. N3/727 TaxID=2925845 RepID=UPI001F5335B4|nr:DUF6470 family protein [Paenibacillus sp. N3/727]UNK18071.1 DUF6470 family protein [Paenibacillus sp. N3/727]